MDPTEPVEVYSSFNPAEAEIIQNMLVAEGIEARAAGLEQGGFPGTTPEVSVLVHAKDADRARKLILDHQKHATKTSDEDE
jgi:hypothetical protein